MTSIEKPSDLDIAPMTNAKTKAKAVRKREICRRLWTASYQLEPELEIFRNRWHRENFILSSIVQLENRLGRQLTMRDLYRWFEKQDLAMVDDLISWLTVPDSKAEAKQNMVKQIAELKQRGDI